MGDLEASWLGQWSHLSWFKLRQHVTFVLSETPSGTTLPSECMSELGASPESRLREDLSVGSLLGGVLLTSCWESERYRIQAVIQSSEDLNQLWSGAWPLELIQTGAALPGSWTFTPMASSSHPPTSHRIWAALRNRVMWPWTSWLFSARTSPRKAASNCHSHLGVLQYLSDMARSLPSIRTDHCQKLICPKLSGLGFSLAFFPLFFPFLPPFYQPLIDALLCSRYTLLRSRNSDIFKKGFSACSKASVQIKRQTRQQNGQWWWPVELKK